MLILRLLLCRPLIQLECLENFIRIIVCASLGLHTSLGTYIITIVTIAFEYT